MMTRGEQIADLVLAWRQAPRGGSAVERMRGAWVFEIREVVWSAVRGFRLGVGEDEDLVQGVVERVVPRIERGEVESGAEAAYARRAGEHAAVSLLRRKERADIEFDPERDTGSAQVPTPEDHLGLRQSRDDAAELVAEALRRMPASYRDVLDAIEIRGVDREELAQEELSRRIRSNQVPEGLEDDELERCRGKIYADLSRAKRRMKQVVLEILAERGRS